MKTFAEFLSEDKTSTLADKVKKKAKALEKDGSLGAHMARAQQHGATEYSQQWIKKANAKPVQEAAKASKKGM